MKRLLLPLLLLSLFLCEAQTPGRELFYVGTFTSEGAEGVYICAMEKNTGNLLLLDVYKGIDNPGFLRISPDKKLLYVAGRAPHSVDPDGGFVSTYRILGKGRLEFLGKQSSCGADPCYIDVSQDGQLVAVANYGGGSVVLFERGKEGALLPALSVVQHEGSGPVKSRQSRSFAHSIRFAASENRLWAADLGSDRLYAYQIDKINGRLLPDTASYAVLPPGSGPRHFEFSDDYRFIYVANELNSTVTVFERNQGAVKEIQTLSTLPEGFSEKSYCADIHLSPGKDMIYVSNRGHNSIAVFQCAPDGKLTFRTHVSTEGDWPRNFTIDPSGQFMLVANQRSHNIIVFRLNNGIPEFTGHQLHLPAPVCLEFL